MECHGGDGCDGNEGKNWEVFDDPVMDESPLPQLSARHQSSLN